MKKLIILLSFVLLISCTQNQRAKQWGGTSRIELQKGQKLINITFKESNLWVLTKPMTEKDSAETYNFQENSSWGIMVGTVIIIETK